MNRLTLKDDEYWVKSDNQNKAIQKLGQLEDIEEELGIDLITLFKALKNGIWSKGGWYEPCYLDAEPVFIKPEDLRIGKTWYSQQNSENDDSSHFIEKNKLCLFDMDYEVEQHIVKVCDYGKTWALTKEELEK